MIELRKLLRLLLDKKADALTLEAGGPPSLRMQGKERPLNLPPLEPFEIDLYLKAVLPEGLEKRGDLEFEFLLSAQERFRVRVRRDGAASSVTFRPSLPDPPP